jgi:hypothetical protein
MRMMIVTALIAVLACGLRADDKSVEWGQFKTASTPDGWKKEVPMDKLGLRVGQFKLPKAEGDKEDAELVLFISPGGGGVEQNLERQVKKFELEKDAKPKVSKIKIGKEEATYQDISGTFLRKKAPFDPNEKPTRYEGYRQLYVIFEGKTAKNEDVVYSLTLVGPAKTIEKHKKEFDEWVKSFK